ncbi:hypothetical protein [Actinoplanes nipponensis]|uniref:Uncharacterized protein n=1 Tax=Actinoplanes nipponensis TaxID=135950 RepID=A0A919JIC1_9ACTN|nr:hypothetical protein [Actinoplanes nipponensis]GIE49815.1 hypothetical protein Ani05nite_33490 [Actinoplanes nipponensis]
MPGGISWPAVASGPAVSFRSGASFEPAASFEPDAFLDPAVVAAAVVGPVAVDPDASGLADVAALAPPDLVCRGADRGVPDAAFVDFAVVFAAEGALSEAASFA